MVDVVKYHSALSRQIANKTLEGRAYLGLSALALLVGTGLALSLSGPSSSNHLPQTGELIIPFQRDGGPDPQHYTQALSELEITIMERLNGK